MKAGPACGANTTSPKLLPMWRVAASRPRSRNMIPSCFNRRKRGGESSEAGSRVQIDLCCSGVSERFPKENVPDGKMGFGSGGKRKDSNRGSACGAPAVCRRRGASSAEHLHKRFRGESSWKRKIFLSLWDPTAYRH